MTAPEKCPSCQSDGGWKELINPFATGIPVGKNLRFSIGVVKRPFWLKSKCRYRCEVCGYEEEYDPYEPPRRW